MKLPKKIEKEKKKKGEAQPPIGGGALERLHQFEQERGLPETILERPEPVVAESDKESDDSDLTMQPKDACP